MTNEELLENMERTKVRWISYYPLINKIPISLKITTASLMLMFLARLFLAHFSSSGCKCRGKQLLPDSATDELVPPMGIFKDDLRPQITSRFVTRCESRTGENTRGRAEKVKSEAPRRHPGLGGSLCLSEVQQALTVSPPLALTSSRQNTPLCQDGRMGEGHGEGCSCQSL